MKIHIAKLPALAAIGLLAIASNLEAKLVYSGGHADIGIAYEEDEGFFLHYHLHTGAVLDGSPIGGDEEYAPGEILTYLPESTKNTIGANAMIGTTAGNPDVWVLPQVEQPGVPFLGFGTEELDSGWSNITFTLDAVVSPAGSGNFSLWSTGTFGEPTFYFSTANPSGTALGSNTLIIPPGTHAHYNLGFTEMGIWEITLTATGTHPDYGFVSDTQTFTFGVVAVPEPSTYGLMVGGLLIGACAARRWRRSRAEGTKRLRPVSGAVFLFRKGSVRQDAGRHRLEACAPHSVREGAGGMAGDRKRPSMGALQHDFGDGRGGVASAGIRFEDFQREGVADLRACCQRGVWASRIRWRGFPLWDSSSSRMRS